MTTRISSFILSSSLLAGTIIGAGVFALPYIFKTSGFLTGTFYLALGAAVYIALYIMYAQVINGTDGQHRFVGYARIYLGKFASLLAILTSVVQTVLVLTIYLILAQSFARLITEYGQGTDALILFWLLGSLIIFIGIRRLAWLELIITGGMVAVLMIVFFLGLTSGGNATGTAFLPNLGALLFPLGPVLFSLSGRQAVPDMVKLNGNYKKSIAVGVIVPAAIYLVFVMSVLALSPVVTEDAVSGLMGNVPGLLLLAIVGVFGILSLLSSYGTIGLDVFESLELDFHLPLWARFLIVVLGPLLLYFAGAQSFVSLVSFAGGVFLALEGIFIIGMWLRMKRRRFHPGAILMLAVFVTALVYEILKR